MSWARRIRRMVLGPRLADTGLPTADYYFLGALADLVRPAHASAAHEDRPIRALGPHTFAAADRLVVIRYANAAELELLDGRRWRSIHYVVDDLLPVADQCIELPADYRQRLTRFAHEVLPRILDRNPVVVAPSPAILEHFDSHETHHLDPCWLSIANDHSFFDGLAHGEPARLAFLGTRSHLPSWPFLAGVAEELATLLPQARLNVFLGSHIPRALQRLPNVVNHPGLPWAEFKQLARTQRFHFGLAPVPHTLFARGRSITKVMDHAAFGAIGAYSPRPPFEGVITPDVDGLLLGDDPKDWARAIADLVADPRRARRMAEAGAMLARERGAPGRVRRFWLDQLDLRP